MNSKLLVRLLTPLAARIMSRPPDQIIGPPSDPYMLRWRLLPKGPWPNVYFHEFHRSDDARALHDHPTDNASLILDGSYAEIFGQPALERGKSWLIARRPGDIVFRFATTPHRLALFDGPHGPSPVTTVFLCGPRRRGWGWHCLSGWIPWKQYDAQKGCDQ